MITGIDTSAPVVVRLDITIDAPVDRVWALHTDIAAWPTWQNEITAAKIDGPLTAGATFHWSTFGLDIASTVRLIDRRTASCGAAPRTASPESTCGPSRPPAAAAPWSAPRSPGTASPSAPTSPPCRPLSTNPSPPG
ncbi:SRPBCC family protein [Sphaerisporangium corydalis]|uniref:SRPBCC family protein n=1 Tax=Sphaerisporangium corydalis TaxID=1441875 RepID=A0ABV9E9V6_9ACTN|nr:SRPBCC family protein [Sphaerisporangium corydalis]